jgi:hypothetical protein
LTIEYFHTTGDAAGEPADVGRGKLASSAVQYADPPLMRLACRDGARRLGGEREMLARISDAITSAGYGF